MKSAHICEKCRVPGHLPNDTFKVYDDANNLVGKLYRFVVVDMDGRYYAKAIAADPSWIAFEAEQLQKAVPALYPAAYTHAGRLNITSDPQDSEDAARALMDAQFAEARAWLEQRVGPIEIVS
jgi:hypothetical protein